jgi:hypothetical protein
MIPNNQLWFNKGAGNTPVQIGTFLQNQFTLSDFVATNLTKSNPTASTLRLVQNTHSLGICSAYYSPYLTGRDKFTMTVNFTINTHNAESWGFGPSICTYGGGGDDYLSGIVGNGVGFNDTTIYLWAGPSTLLSTHAGTLPTPAINDIIQCVLDVNINTYTFTATNLTQGGTDSISYSETYTSGVMKTTRALSYYGFRLFGGDYTVNSWNVSTTEYKYSDILLISDSKGVGGYCGTVANKAIEVIKTNNPTKRIVNNSGFNDQSDRIALKQPELLAYKASQVWLMVGSNDLRFGVASYQAKYSAIIAAHQANGSTVKILNCLAEAATGVNVSPVNTYWGTTGLTVVDLYTPSQTAGLLKAIYNSGDDVHPNGLCNTAVIATGMQTIV